MIRKLMASSAVIALMSAGAFTAQAQTDPAAPPPLVQQDMTAAPADAATSDLVASDDTLTPDQPTLASAFVGRSVYASTDPESDNIGDVNDLIISDDGTITHAIVGVGGFLGIGEKDVAVPFDDLEVVESEGDIRLIYAATREQLEAAPALDRTAFDPQARFADEQAAQIETNAVPPAGGDIAAASAPVVDPLATAPAEDMAEAATPLPADMTFVSFAPDQVRATTIIGMSVYGPDDQSIGEVSDIVVQEADKARVALVDIGGFLGVGEKTVAIPFNQLTFAPVAEDGSTKVTVAMAKDQLEQLPAFELPAETAAINDAPAAAVDAAQPDATAEQMAAAPATAPDQMTTGSIATEYAPATQDISTNDLIGAVVYGPDDASVGEISDIVFDKMGQIQGAIVDVGGFLGIGEKPVAIGLEDLNVRADESGSLVVMVKATKDQLELAPAYQQLDADSASTL